MKRSQPLAVAGERRECVERRVVVQDAVVDFVAEQQQAVAARDVDERFEQRARIRGAGRVVRVDQHDGARARRHQRRDFVRIRQEPVLRLARVVDRAAVVEDGRGAPQRIVG